MITFDEQTYLDDNPDVRAAIVAGLFQSGEDHYHRVGKAEGRELALVPLASSGERSNSASALPEPPPFGVEQLVASASGHVLVVGWVDDRSCSLHGFALGHQGRLVHKPGLKLRRLVRPDVANHLHGDPAYEFGFWSVFRTSLPQANGPFHLVLQLAGTKPVHSTTGRWVSITEFRSLLLGYLAIRSRQLGYPPVELSEYSMASETVSDLSADLQRVARSSIRVSNFNERESPLCSLIVVLYQNSSMLYPQARLFAQAIRGVDGELVVVNNSPETEGEVRHEVRRIAASLGIPIRLVQPAGNLSFGGGNNVGVQAALGKYVILINPDVVPYGVDDLIFLLNSMRRKEAQNAIIGARLLYDDGSLMHDGMELFFDEVPLNTVRSETVVGQLLRVEHIGKGDPAMAESRRLSYDLADVPAISGALMGMRKSVFERLGGFDERYLFGHYEDVDLCLRAARSGCRIAIQRGAYFFHLEGKSSDFSSYQVAGAVGLNRIRCSISLANKGNF